MEVKMIKQMREECKNSIFLDEVYDNGIIGLDGMTGSVIYDIDWLAELEMAIMNSRDYDFRVAMNGGARYYENFDALKVWKKRFKDLDQRQKKGLLGMMAAPSYMLYKTDKPTK
jgi:hypothetical protein